MKQLPLPAHPVFPSRLDSIAALPELLRNRQIGCVLVIGDAHAVDCESLLLPVLEDSQIMYAVHAAVSLSDSKDGALTRTDVDTALQAFTDKQAQAILAVGGNDAMALGQALLARLETSVAIWFLQGFALRLSLTADPQQSILALSFAMCEALFGGLFCREDAEADG